MSRRSDKKMKQWVHKYGDRRSKEHFAGGGRVFHPHDLFVAIDFHCRKHQHRLLRAGMDTAPTYARYTQLSDETPPACICEEGATDPCAAHEFWWTDMRPDSALKASLQYGRTQGVDAKTQIVCSDGCHVQLNTGKVRAAVKAIWRFKTARVEAEFR